MKYLLFLLFIAGCTSAPKPSLTPLPSEPGTEDQIPVSKMKEYCDKGGYIACYNLGQQAFFRKDFQEAENFLKKIVILICMAILALNWDGSNVKNGTI